jgi:hypothetical protein
VRQPIPQGRLAMWAGPSIGPAPRYAMRWQPPHRGVPVRREYGSMADRPERRAGVSAGHALLGAKSHRP